MFERVEVIRAVQGCTARLSGTNTRHPALFTCLLLSLTICAPAIAADDAARLNEIRERIKDVESSLRTAHDESDALLAELQQAEAAIIQSRARVSEINAEVARKTASLEELNTQAESQRSVLAQQRGQLADQVRAAYRSGRHDYLKLLLNQEDPALLGRMLAYHDYTSRARARNIEVVAAALNNLASIQNDIGNEAIRLEQLRMLETARLAELEAQRESRGMVLARLRETISFKDRELALLQRNEQELARLLDRLREEDRDRIESVNDVLISTPQGLVLQAKNLLDMTPQKGPTQIERKNQQRILRVNAELDAGTVLGDGVKAVQARLPEIPVPQGFQVGFGAEVEQQAQAFSQLQVLLILGVLLVYAVMASQYESLRDPFIVMFSVPVAAIGVVAALKLTSTSFSLQAYIGVIMLGGIVVSNAILLVDYTNTLRRRDGMPLREAVELAGRRRLRPILMTSIATGLGLVPMAIGLGEGGELQAPLARVVIGGLAVSTVVTLVLVPSIYTLFEEGLAGLRRRPATQA